MDVKCSMCNGTGFKSTVEACPHCGQDVLVYHNDGPPCEFCRGVGRVEIPDVRFIKFGDKNISAGPLGGHGGNDDS